MRVVALPEMREVGDPGALDVDVVGDVELSARKRDHLRPVAAAAPVKTMVSSPGLALASRIAWRRVSGRRRPCSSPSNSWPPHPAGSAPGPAIARWRPARRSRR